MNHLFKVWLGLLLLISSLEASELVDACMRRDIETVQKIILAHGDLNAKNDQGIPALVAAAYLGHTRIVKMLLENGAQPNDRVSGSWLGFMRYMGQANQVKNFSPEINWVPDMSIDASHLPQLFLTQEEELNALMVASYKGYEDIVQLLLDHQADVNAQTKKGWSALMFAATMGNANIVEQLLKKGAGVNAKDKKQFTALIDSIYSGSYASFRHLMQAKAQTDDELLSQVLRSPLQLAAHFGRLDMVKDLVEAGAKLDYTGLSMKNALVFAVESGHYEVVKYLFEKGSDYQSNGLLGPSPLEIARQKKYKKIEALLNKS